MYPGYAILCRDNYNLKPGFRAAADLIVNLHSNIAALASNKPLPNPGILHGQVRNLLEFLEGVTFEICRQDLAITGHQPVEIILAQCQEEKDAVDRGEHGLEQEYYTVILRHGYRGLSEQDDGEVLHGWLIMRVAVLNDWEERDALVSQFSRKDEQKPTADIGAGAEPWVGV